MSMKKYYPTAFALYMTYFVLGVAGSIMGQYQQELAGLWGAQLLADGTYLVNALGEGPDVSGIPVTVYRFTDPYGPEEDEDAGAQLQLREQAVQE